MNLLSIFLTGLLSGGLTCFALQGGLLATTIAQQAQKNLENKTKTSGKIAPIVLFLAAKLAAYTILGFLLGLFGSVFQLSPITQAGMQVAVGIFMLGTALNLLEVHPIFRYFSIQPPKSLTKLVFRQAKKADYFAPLFLGAITIFIPCGVTQAMMALAIASGNPMLGAITLFVFVLGTSPLFFVLGFLATKLSSVISFYFYRLTAIILIILSIYTINTALIITGSKYTLTGLWHEFYCTVLDTCSTQIPKEISPNTAVNEATINIESNRYNPDTITVKAGSSITLHIKNISGSGCIQAFTIPRLGIQKIIPVGKSETIQFTAPNKPGPLPFMCSMGMYRGNIIVI